MRLLVALAFIALASASAEPVPVELPAASLPSDAQPTKDTPTVAASTTTAAKVEPVKISTPELPAAASTAEAKVEAPVKLDLSNLRADLPLNDPEAMRKLFPNPMSLIDIRPLLVPQEVMRQVSQMAQSVPQESNGINVGGAHPFSFDNAEPLDSEVRVKVVDTPINQLDAEMNPVLVVETPIGEQVPFDESPQIPDGVKVIDQIPIDISRPLPIESWRGPPRYQVPQVVNMPFVKIPESPETVKVVDIGGQNVPIDMARPLPVENWRGPPESHKTIENIPLELFREYISVPPYYRGALGQAQGRLPEYRHPMLR